MVILIIGNFNDIQAESFWQIPVRNLTLWLISKNRKFQNPPLNIIAWDFKTINVGNWTNQLQKSG